MKLNSQQITKFIFWPLEIGVLILISINAYFIFSQRFKDDILFRLDFYSYGMILGLISFVFLTLALLPGILTRFGVKGKIVQQLTIYRRELGKLMFLFAFAHYLTIKVLPGISLNLPPVFPLYQTIGFTALQLTLLMFITSTNWAQKKMGKWWKRLHRIVYLIIWLIFLHVALAQGFTIISAFIFLVAFFEVMSLANFYVFRLNLDNQVNTK